MDYEAAWQLQDRLAAEIAAGSCPPTLLLLEHPHTYTFGRSGHAENLLWDETELALRGVKVHWVDRGGDITYHGPGQLVGYPLLPLVPGGLRPIRTGEPGEKLRLPQADYIGYLRKLEQALILALKEFGVDGCQLEGMTGVWVPPQGDTPGNNRPPAKIAAIGVKVDANGISRHGFALNVDPDMTYWQGIIGCGLAGYPVTGLADLCRPAPEMHAVMDAVIRAFGKIFGYQMKDNFR